MSSSTKIRFVLIPMLDEINFIAAESTIQLTLDYFIIFFFHHLATIWLTIVWFHLKFGANYPKTS